MCDGMGGHNAGDIASEMAVLQLGNSWKQSSFEASEIKQAEAWLTEHINEENKRIFDAATVFHDLHGMGTTLVAAVLFEETTLIANIGDSRAYIIEETGLTRVTEDHSFANELKLTGQISEEEAMTHEKRNTLTRSLGVGTTVKIDFFYVSNFNKKFLLLCSDGLSNAVSEQQMSQILLQPSDEQTKADQLINKAIEQDAADNATLCLIHFEADKRMVTEAGSLEGGAADGNR